jgi:hypothetical protein
MCGKPSPSASRSVPPESPPNIPVAYASLSVSKWLEFSSPVSLHLEELRKSMGDTIGLYNIGNKRKIEKL